MPATKKILMAKKPENSDCQKTKSQNSSATDQVGILVRKQKMKLWSFWIECCHPKLIYHAKQKSYGGFKIPTLKNAFLWKTQG